MNTRKQIKVGVFQRQLEFSVRQLIVFVLVFGVLGGYLVYRSSAAQPVVASVEVERMALPSNATIVSDSTASGGQAVKMSSNGTINGTVNLPSNATSETLNARGVRCKGSWPSVSVQVDSKSLMSTTVDSNGWKSFSANAALGAGTHTLTINASGFKTCRVVYLDVLTFYGPSAPTPVPTVSLSASPTNVSAGSSSTLTWSSMNASSCSASGAWSGSKSTSGSVSTGALNASSIYNLSCSGSSGSTAISTTVSVSAATQATNSIYWGAYINGSTYGTGRTDAPWDYTTWDLFESHAGKKISIIHYGQPPMWQQIFYPDVASRVTSRGAIPLIDMSSESVPLTDITSGKYDSSIKTWANAIKSWGHPMLYRWNWEMNGTWFNWGAQAQQNPANFVAAWRHIHDVVVSQGASNVTWVWCPNAVFTGSTPLSSLYPGDSYVDWTCIDGYNRGPLNGDTWKSFYQIFQPTYNQLLSIAPTKPIIIGETASNENGGSKSAWITDAFNTQLPTNFPKIKAVVWFNWPIYENGVTQQWPIESSSSAQAAFAQAIASPYYASNNYGNLPPLTKVQPIQ